MSQNSELSAALAALRGTAWSLVMMSGMLNIIYLIPAGKFRGVPCLKWRRRAALHSALMLAARITLAHISISAAMRVANSFGVLATTS